MRSLPTILWAPRYCFNVFLYCVRCWRGRVVAWLATAVAIGGVLSLAAGAELFLVLADRSLNQQMRSASEFQVFLQDDAQQAQIDDLRTRLLTQPGVKRVTYRSKAEALRLAQQSAVLSDIAANTGANPYPASLVVDVTDPAAAGQVSTIAAQSPAADRDVPASYTPAQGQRLSAFLSMARAVVVGVALVALGVCGFVSLVLLRSEIRARRSELRILALVGTPRPVIRLPVLLEAAALAVAGSLLASSALRLVGDHVVPSVNSYLPFLQLGSAAGPVQAISLVTLISSLAVLGACSIFVRLPR